MTTKSYRTMSQSKGAVQKQDGQWQQVDLHDHVATLDEQGNGETATILEHSHKVENFRVQEANEHTHDLYVQFEDGDCARFEDGKAYSSVAFLFRMNGHKADSWQLRIKDNKGEWDALACARAVRALQAGEFVKSFSEVQIAQIHKALNQAFLDISNARH